MMFVRATFERKADVAEEDMKMTSQESAIFPIANSRSPPS